MQLYSTVTLRQIEKKHYNNKTDVYSLGIVLWELLTNRITFEGMSNLQAEYKVLNSILLGPYSSISWLSFLSQVINTWYKFLYYDLWIYYAYFPYSHHIFCWIIIVNILICTLPKLYLFGNNNSLSYNHAGLKILTWDQALVRSSACSMRFSLNSVMATTSNMAPLLSFLPETERKVWLSSPIVFFKEDQKLTLSAKFF